MSNLIDRHPLLSPEEFRELAREVSIHTDDDVISQFIREGEDIFLLPAIGWPVLKAATVTNDWSGMADTFDEEVLIDGGEYAATDNTCGCSSTGVFYCNGLKKALAYWVYAKMIRNDGNIIARAGSMVHNDQYASHVNDPQIKRYDDTMEIAERYLGECTAYINSQQDNNTYTVKQTRVRIIAIGD